MQPRPSTRVPGSGSDSKPWALFVPIAQNKPQAARNQVEAHKARSVKTKPSGWIAPVTRPSPQRSINVTSSLEQPDRGEYLGSEDLEGGQWRGDQAAPGLAHFSVMIPSTTNPATLNIRKNDKRAGDGSQENVEINSCQISRFVAGLSYHEEPHDQVEFRSLGSGQATR